MQTIIERIKKLLSLATSDNENEARLAATMANELLTKHNLNMSVTQSHEYCRETMDIKSRANPADKFVNTLLGKFFFVTIVKSKTIASTSYIILGTRENVEIALYVYDFLIRAFASSFKASKLPAKDRSGFYYGVWQGLCEQLETNRTKVQNEMGLVVVPDAGLKAYVHEQFNVVKQRSHTVKISQGVVAAGQAEGRNMRISRGISGSNNGLRLKA